MKNHEINELHEFGRIYHSSDIYSRKGARSNLKSQKRKISKFKNYLVNKKILEIGCGRGNSLIVLQSFTKYPVKAIEINPDFCMKLRKKGFDVRCSDAEKRLPFKDESFDVVYSDQVLEHLVSPAKFLNEVRKVLRKGGILILGVPNTNTIFKSAYYNPVHLGYYTKKTLKCTLKSMGFNIHKILSYPFTMRIHLMVIAQKIDGKEYFKEKVEKLIHQVSKEELEKLFIKNWITKRNLFILRKT